MLGKKIQAFFTKPFTAKTKDDPWVQRAKVLAEAYKKSGYAKELPQLKDIKYLISCLKLGLDPVYAVRPPYQPLHIKGGKIIVQPKQALYDRLQRNYFKSSSSTSSNAKHVSFANEVQVIRSPSVPSQPLKGIKEKAVTHKSSKSGPTQLFLTFDQVKAQLKTMSPQELTEAYSAACSRATPDRVPLTIRALSDLHHEAVYVRNGQVDHATWFIDPFRDARAFVNRRLIVANMPIPGHSLPLMPTPEDAVSPEGKNTKKTSHFCIAGPRKSSRSTSEGHPEKSRRVTAARPLISWGRSW